MSAIVSRRVVVGARTLQVREVPGDGPGILLLHGFPGCAASWDGVLDRAAAAGQRAVAFDLPGIGGSDRGDATGAKVQLSRIAADVATALQLSDPVLVGHDIGAMIGFAALRSAPEFRRVLMLNGAAPGVAPWAEVAADPMLWHFRFQRVPALAELLVHGNERVYVDYFVDVLGVGGPTIADRERDDIAAALAVPGALNAAFDWYRAFDDDAAANAGVVEIDTPVLYVSGADPFPLDRYEQGLRAAGLSDVRTAVLDGSGHYSPLDAPGPLWELIGAFANGDDR